MAKVGAAVVVADIRVDVGVGRTVVVIGYAVGAFSAGVKPLKIPGENINNKTATTSTPAVIGRKAHFLSDFFPGGLDAFPSL